MTGLPQIAAELPHRERRPALGRSQSRVVIDGDCRSAALGGRLTAAGERDTARRSTASVYTPNQFGVLNIDV